MESAVEVSRIDGNVRTIRQLFYSKLYDIDYYQREYAWSQANVQELLQDLSHRFSANFEPNHELPKVEFYRPYFLGPIVTNTRDGILFLVDGQQRLTTLTLLLIYLHRLQKDRPEDQQVDVRSLVALKKFGRNRFVLDVESRAGCFQDLLEGRVPEVKAGDDSLTRLIDRYEDIDRFFPDDLKDGALPFFIEWLLERVIVVEVNTSDQGMALEIFESMNDRGMRLTTTDMLKSYLLSKMEDPARIDAANDLWRSQIAKLCAAEDKTESDFIKHWLRAKYADSIRQRRKDAFRMDFDLIGTTPHKWVVDNGDALGLRRPEQYGKFVDRDFKRLSDRFLTILGAARKLTPGLEEIFYNNWTGFTFQFPLLLAAVTPVDDEETFRTKAKMVAGYLDLWVARRMVSQRTFGYNTVAYTMFNLVKEIRDLEAPEIAVVLGAKVAELDTTFEGAGTFGLHQRNGSHVKYLLARLTAWVEQQCQGALTFADLVDRHRDDPFEIEHIWANHSHDHPDLDEHDFADQRQRFGGLLLLPKSFNASFGDDPYPKKVQHYFHQNSLASSLNTLAYTRNPRFNALASAGDLPFVAHPDEFTSESMAQRSHLYRALCERVWDPLNYGLRFPGAQPENAPAVRVPFSRLVATNLVPHGSNLVGTRVVGDDKETVMATVTASGQIRLSSSEAEFNSPDDAGRAEKVANGWDFWRVVTPAGPVRLSRLRQELAERL